MDIFFQNTTNIILAIIAISSGFSLLILSLSGKGVSLLSVTQASVLMNARVQIVDVRPAESFAAGHIANSKSLPFNIINEQLSLLKLKKEKAVVLICERGITAAKAARILSKNGFSDVHVLDQGLKAWREAQYPLIK